MTGTWLSSEPAWFEPRQAVVLKRVVDPATLQLGLRTGDGAQAARAYRNLVAPSAISDLDVDPELWGERLGLSFVTSNALLRAAATRSPESGQLREAWRESVLKGIQSLGPQRPKALQGLLGPNELLLHAMHGDVLRGLRAGARITADTDLTDEVEALAVFGRALPAAHGVPSSPDRKPALVSLQAAALPSDDPDRAQRVLMAAETLARTDTMSLPAGLPGAIANVLVRFVRPGPRDTRPGQRTTPA